MAMKEGIGYADGNSYVVGGMDIANYKGKSLKGKTLYKEISRDLGSPKAASEFLARADIDGIKYPVDSYGGKAVKDGDKAGWNYVSFRDDNIRVDHKWRDGEMLWSKAVEPLARDFEGMSKERLNDLRARYGLPPIARYAKVSDAEVEHNAKGLMNNITEVDSRIDAILAKPRAVNAEEVAALGGADRLIRRRHGGRKPGRRRHQARLRHVVIREVVRFLQQNTVIS